MRCKLNDLVMVVRSEIGNEGRIVGRANLSAALPGGLVVYPEDDWLVEGRFATADEFILSFVEMMRGVIGTEVPQPPDLRAWGRVTQDAIRLGYIERVPKVVIPAVSSNGSVKPAWRRGAKA